MLVEDLESLSISRFIDQTTLHPISVIALLLLGVGMLLAPRRYALVPMVILACSISPGQRVVIATLDFNFMRILVLIGFVRIYLFEQERGFQWKATDKLVLAWAICATIIGTILQGSVAGTIYQLGLFYDAVCVYFLCRLLVRDWEDVRGLAQGAAILSIPMVLAFVVELTTRNNLFSVFGGVPPITLERAGRLHCQGPFSHPILAGCFWAALMPLVGSLWWSRGWNRTLAVIGLVACGFLLFATGSTTPLGGAFVGLLAALIFPLRRWMSWIRWGVVGALLAIQLVMNGPIWHLISRIDIIAGSTAWYRHKVIDEFIRHFRDWCLIGTESYVGWWEWGYDDLTNEYVAQGIRGGLLTLLLFLGIIIVAFRAVGASVKREESRVRARVSLDRPNGHPEAERRYSKSGHHQPKADSATGSPVSVDMPERTHRAARVAMAWSLGVALFVHCSVFFGVSYFGQAVFGWYLTLGLIGSMAPATASCRIAIRQSNRREADAPRLRLAPA